jgi:uncharacterized protein (TIGR02001 family)
MGHFRSKLAWVVLCCVAAATACASETVGGSLALTNDYVYRGVSFSQGQAALQGSVHIQPVGGFTIGAWASTLSSERKPWAHYEVDLYASKAWALSQDWSARLGVTHFAYLQSRVGGGFDHDELAATLSFRERINATVAWMPNLGTYAETHVEHHPARAYELTGVQPLFSAWSLYAGVGYYDLSALYPRSYWYWNTGLAFSWQSLQLDLQRIDTDDAAKDLFGRQSAGSRWVASLNWRF